MTNTITLPRVVVEQALEALDELHYSNSTEAAENLYLMVVGALRAALERPDESAYQRGYLDGMAKGRRDAAMDHTEQHLDMVPTGWKLVPVEPNMSMTQSALNASRRWAECDAPLPRGQELWAADVCWSAMLAAAPQPPVGEQEKPSRWPADAKEVRAFLSGHVAAERYARDDHQPDDSDTYMLSAHDLLGAIDWWTDFDQRPRQPLTDEQINTLFQWGCGQSFRDFARAIERAHGIGGEA